MTFVMSHLTPSTYIMLMILEYICSSNKKKKISNIMNTNFNGLLLIYYPYALKKNKLHDILLKKNR